MFWENNILGRKCYKYTGTEAGIGRYVWGRVRNSAC